MARRAPRRIGVSRAKLLMQEAQQLFNEQCAIAILANLPARLNSRERSLNIEDLSHKSVDELRPVIATLRKKIEELRAEFGIKLDRSALLAILDHLQESTNQGKACFVPVSKLSEWLSMYDELGLDPHCRISIDPLCIGRDDPDRFELRQLEISLFEDMASLFNLAREMHRQITTTGERAKVELKRAAALYRAVVSASFYFIECFMNEIAADYVWRHRSKIRPNDLALLTEWDNTRQRAKFVKTRDKLVIYPRIVSGSEHPPLDENNCPELKFIVTKAKDFRDAIVHASTAREDAEEEYEKEAAFMEIKYDTIEMIVDASISLIRKIEVATFKRDLPWLIGRGEDGLFPARVFD